MAVETPSVRRVRREGVRDGRAAWAVRARWVAARLDGPAAAVLTGALAFDAGGYFPIAISAAAIAACLALLLRITVVEEPLAGWSRTAAVVALAGAGFASWTLLSALWSEAPLRALLEFDRALLYLLVFVFFATLPRRSARIAVVLRWVLLAIVAVAVAALGSRLYPEVVDVAVYARLAYPLTYWNALSVLCALGAVLALHAASGREEPLPVRVLAGAALPVLAVAGYFPFSRGGIATAIVGVTLYALVAHPRRGLLTLLTAGPATAIALHVAYGADVLATVDYPSAAGRAEGRHLALVLLLAAAAVVAGRLALVPVERRLDRLALARPRPLVLAAAAAVAVALLVAGALALDAPGYVRDQVHSFSKGNVVPNTADLRNRLGARGNNGRLDLWETSLTGFRAERLQGTGAGTFGLEWERERADPIQTTEGHSLYLEVLGELGIVGLALIAVMLVALLAGASRRLKGEDRHAAAAVVAAGTALALHAAVDWDWEMPSLWVWLFAAGGVAAGLRPGEARIGSLGRLPRVAAGLLCAFLAITPAAVAISQHRLNRAAEAFEAGNCSAAVDSALGSLQVLSARPEPYEILGYCDLRTGHRELAVTAMTAARERDPHNWRYAYGLAAAQAIAGKDPRRAAAAALRANPKEPLARELAKGVRTSSPRGWFRAAARARIPIDSAR